MKRIFLDTHRLRHTLPFAAACFTVGIVLFACADKDVETNDNNGKALVTFNVSAVQSKAQEQAKAAAKAGLPMTRAAFANQLALQNLAPEDLTMQKLPVQGAAASSDLCLIETTVPGLPSQWEDDAPTRANITTMPTMQNFSTTAFYGSSDTSLEPWFYDKDTKKDGTLVTPIYWDWVKTHACFYAVYPKPDNNKIKLSPASHTGTPYVDFEVEPNVTNQKDLMTACSGNVHTDIGTMSATAPRTDLTFRHALTAVRFKVGQNLSWNKTITKVEIVGAKSKARYTLPTTAGAAGTWGTPSTPATFTLSGLSFSTSDAVNNVIVGKGTDNGTFYMLPQTLTGAGVQVKVYFNGAATPAITATLTGQWKPGTTKTYALSQNTSDWSYVLNVVSPTTPAAYNQTAAGNYTIQSYRQSGGTLQPVKWKVIGYEEYNAATSSWVDKGMTRPAWLDALPKTEGDGGTIAEGGAATVQKSIIDKIAAYNNVLQTATPRGSAGSYYDLSEHDYKGNSTNRNTANSYLISAPGYYKIPLVYGNAIENGIDNPHSYKTTVAGGLQNFIDHADVNIDDPWITQTNSGANVPDGAKIVWTDQSGIVEASSLGIEGSGTNAFVHFHVPADKIKNGNAVIAVTKGGTIVWSWHLWFAKDDVLNTITLGYSGGSNNFTKQTLGAAYIKWEGSAYDEPRQVRIKVEQEVANGGTKQNATITITQNPGSVKNTSSTLYQWGRKDALPGTDAIADGSYAFASVAANRSVGYAIQHPEIMIHTGNNWGWCSTDIYNLWSMDDPYLNGTPYVPVVKTIYDPSPAGFRIVHANGYSSFTTSGVWENGWNFRSYSGPGSNTVYFPATGARDPFSGVLTGVGTAGYYWSVCRGIPQRCWGMVFSAGYFSPATPPRQADAWAVHPVTE